MKYQGWQRMSKETKKMAVPKLRFPEFKNAGNWSNESMEKLFDFLSTNSFSRDKLNYNMGTVKNIHYGDIHTKFKTLFKLQKEVVPFINESESIERIKPECYCAEGDMVFADASEDLEDIGKSIELVDLNNEKLLSGLHTILARPKEKTFALGFSGYLFKSTPMRSQIQKESQGAKVLGISAKKMAKMSLLFPMDKKEQQKIADCLSSLDELIITQGDKVDTLKNYKKGLLQQIFPQEGETVPKLRFPEFETDGDWAETELSKALIPDIRGTKKPSSNYLALGIRSHGKGTFLKPDEDPKKNAMDTLFEVHENDLIVNITFAWEGAIAVVKKEDHGALVSHRFPTYVFNSGIAIVDFFRYIIFSPRFVYNLGLISPGGAGRNRVMSKTDFLKLKVLLPKVKEQMKIAKVLISLDELIVSEDEKLNHLKGHKKGLLQQLFPFLDTKGDN